MDLVAVYRTTTPPAAAPAAPPAGSAAEKLAAANASAMTVSIRRQSVGLGRITAQERDHLSA